MTFAKLTRNAKEPRLREGKVSTIPGPGRRKSICAAFLLCAVAAFAAPKTTYKQLFHFSGTDGSNANALVQGTDGNLYGTTQTGGPRNAGTIFKITPGGTLTTLYNFCSDFTKNNCNDGLLPESGLLLATDGNFYGTTNSGGAENYGTVFKVTPAGTLTTLYSFCSKAKCVDGALPKNPLIQGADGNFYGTTDSGGANTQGGTLFKITPAGKLKTLYSFCALKDCLDGSAPAGALVQDADGNFYGVTFGGGGVEDWGTAFKITSTGALTSLHVFCASTCTDGASPEGLALGTDGNLYGITASGGTNGGTAFKMTTDGTLTTLYNFCTQPGCTDGQLPNSTVVEGTDGNFYGTAPDGGAYGLGIVYALTPSGGLTTLHSFQGKYSGAFPLAPVVQATSGIFYGATSQGGKGGSIFSLAIGLGPFVETVQSSAKVGKTVMILGQGFIDTTSVSFNGVSAKYTVVSETYLTAKVPKGATSGLITVATSGGILQSNKPFIVVP